MSLLLNSYIIYVCTYIHTICMYCREMFGVIPSKDQDLRDIEDRKRKFLFHLNSSGKYHGIKESLKVCTYVHTVPYSGVQGCLAIYVRTSPLCTYAYIYIRMYICTYVSCIHH